MGTLCRVQFAQVESGDLHTDPVKGAVNPTVSC
jgi:hypothetical protein